ncbi:MAG TPA: hypothetical protein VMW27_04470 [Thermoanaerobaculia bacterium]|nr:hypothetical protein [Thermoanaerobaculia bacterium]
MRKKLMFLTLALALLAGTGLFTPKAAEAVACARDCVTDENGCLCCSYCCVAGHTVTCGVEDCIC